MQVDLDDGLVLDHETVTADVIRDGDAYSGVRVTVSGVLASAVLQFHVDVNPGPLAAVLDGYGPIAQAKWSGWRRKQRL